MRAIADQLGVTKILEGGVQRAGDRVRVTVQLIDAATDAHLWAENYDRELTAANIFAIQSEVAAAIAASLETTLTPSEKRRVNAIPTQSLEAWQNYQLGTQRLARRTSAALTEAQAFFQRAIDVDPGFAPAYAGLADAVWLKADYTGQPFEPAVERAEELLDQALRLDPNLAEAHTTLAKFAQDKREFERAETGYRRAIELNPNYPTAHRWYAQLLGLQGRDAEALQSTQRAAELDPLSVSLQVNVAMGFNGLGRFDAALAALNHARDIDPTSPLPYAGTSAILTEAFGRLDDAVPFMQKAIELDTSGSVYMKRLAQLHLDLGDAAQAGLWLDRATEDVSANAVKGYRYLYLREETKALACARKALGWDPRDSRALALLRNADLKANDAKGARSRYLRAFPELLTHLPPVVDPSNYNAAIDLALVLQVTGERGRAAQLLDRSEALIHNILRMGVWGYGIADVHIHALGGKDSAALAALREAETAGWRGPGWRYYRDFDPNLASIRNEPEFKAVFADIERDMAQQRGRLAARPKDAPLELTDASR